MKKILYSTLFVAGLLAGTSCDDYLDVSSPSVVDADFVFSNSTTTRAALTGGYSDWRSVANSHVFGAGNFYALDIAGSDIERHPEAYSNQLPRHIAESFYENGTAMADYYPDTYLSYFKDDNKNAYNLLFGVIGKANAVITAMENAANFEEIINATEPTALSQMYGEAVALKATIYREMIKYYGDVPYVANFGEVATGLSPRDSIYDVLIAKLETVEKLMFPIGSIPGIEAANKSYFSKTYVQGLIGRMCLEAGGYQTRRDDIKAVDGEGNQLTIETKGQAHSGATYGRRSDWKDLYAKAKGAYERLLSNSGNAVFHLTDPRGADNNGRIFGNPHQYFFQQMHDGDAVYADESIYEYPQQQGNDSDERSYSSGRPCTGSNNQYPNKAYGQARINPAYYYGYFDPNDMRRDVAVTITGSVGAKGVEQLLIFTPGAQAKGGGPSLNKYDENRQKTVWIPKQRRSGINGPYMRMAEIYLGYAEVCAALGDEATAKQYLKTVRERSFPAGKANTDQFIKDCGGSILDAVIEERGFEYAGEGDRRFTLIRTGKLADRIQKIKETTKAMMDGLEANGYYEFENGNVISSHIWTKSVDAKSEYGYRLTTQCPEDKKDDPVLFPGWRGQNDAWESYGLDYKTDKPLTNLAIKGVFTPVSAEEAAALEADGYKKVDWGKTLLKNRAEYDDNLFKGFGPGNYDKAPIYFIALPPNTVGAGYTNGYGFE